ncbi:MAG TPA: hypothetical protein VF681_01425 [Abditibacteriaceae bacterium]
MFPRANPLLWALIAQDACVTGVGWVEQGVSPSGQVNGSNVLPSTQHIEASLTQKNSS